MTTSMLPRPARNATHAIDTTWTSRLRPHAVVLKEPSVDHLLP
jgi:hypothetical protein